MILHSTKNLTLCYLMIITIVTFVAAQATGEHHMMNGSPKSSIMAGVTKEVFGDLEKAILIDAGQVVRHHKRENLAAVEFPPTEAFEQLKGLGYTVEEKDPVFPTGSIRGARNTGTIDLKLRALSPNFLADEMTLGSSTYASLPGNTGLGGIMFDVSAVKEVEVIKLGFQFNGGFGSSNPYEVYKLNSFGEHGASNMFTPSLWTKIASGSTASVYPGGAVTASFAAVIPAGQTQAFYIRGVSRGLISEKTDVDGVVYKSDANIKLMVGAGLPSGTAFSNGYGSDYYVNPNFVTVYYEAPALPTPSPTGSPTARPSTGPTSSPSAHRSSPPSASTGWTCSDGEELLTVSIYTDDWGIETTFQVTDASGNEVMTNTGEYGDNVKAVENKCLPYGNYNFTIFDTYGDGITYGRAGNYTLSAGSIDFHTGSGDFGWNDTVSITLPLDITTECADDEQLFEIFLLLDNYGVETSFELKSSDGAVVLSAPPAGEEFPNNNPGPYDYSMCLPNDVYELSVYDSFGDGMCCFHGYGSYVAKADNLTIVSSFGIFEYSETTFFAVPYAGA